MCMMLRDEVMTCNESVGVRMRSEEWKLLH